jgi:hypothetical protein
LNLSRTKMLIIHTVGDRTESTGLSCWSKASATRWLFRAAAPRLFGTSSLQNATPEKCF